MKSPEKCKRAPVAGIDEYVAALKKSRTMGAQVVCHREFSGRTVKTGSPETRWPEKISALLDHIGITHLFDHQARAMDLIRAGYHVVMATPTASGKSLVYTLPILEKVLENTASRSLYLSPLKALAQDQHKNFKNIGESGTEISFTSGIYDGDTTAWFRKKIRKNPPNILLTNPEMVHLSILAHHRQWQQLIENLDYIVIDEVHTYRGLLGSHLAQIIRRLQRICRFYGSDPVYIFCSATVANPVQLVYQLTGLDAAAVTRSGAPRGRRHVVMLNPFDGPVQATIQLLRAALQRGLRTIVYTQSRKLTELLALWVGEKSGGFKERISAYRAGLLPEERRGIEQKLAAGELLAVISTSALELGIDIGDLDLCILVGYPGSIVATWQRGGRVGRSGQPSALVVVAGEDALDQYFMRNPDRFLEKGPEAAVVNPDNPDILKKHVECAAAEMPLVSGESYLINPAVAKAAAKLVRQARLFESVDGGRIYSRRKMPHRDVDIRGGGSRFTIVCRDTGRHRGEIDGLRVYRETHPGAIYLHRGESLLVTDLDFEQRLVMVAPAMVDYYTKVRTTKETEIIDIFEKKTFGDFQAFYGAVRITEQVTGYEKWHIRGRRKMNIIPLDLPPHVFETHGLWFDIPVEIQDAAEKARLHFMGGIHAVEHAAIGIFPLLVLADRNDLGGLSTPWHPQVNSAAVFIYDGIAGGAGISRQGFRQMETLLSETFTSVSSCGCETGCPACVHSPKCGSGNRPIDKTAAVFILECLLSELKNTCGRRTSIAKMNAASPKPQKRENVKPERLLTASKNSGKVGKKRLLHRRRMKKRKRKPAIVISGGNLKGTAPVPRTLDTDDTPEIRYGVFDLETQRSAREVGGWHRADLMRISCLVLYDAGDRVYHEYLEDQVDDAVEHLRRLDLVIGFNVKRFDYRVLSGYSDFDFKTLPTLDLLDNLYARLGFRLSLDHLARETLGAAKSADGLQALRWWKQGKINEIVTYCRHDVEITRDLYLFGKEHRHLIFKNKAGRAVKAPVAW